MAINQKGDVLISIWQSAGTSVLPLSCELRAVTNLTALPGGSGMIAAALNGTGQAVGSGYIYSDGTIQTLASLLPAATGGPT